MTDQALVDRVQSIMDQAAAKAGPRQKGVISNPAWKADAATFLDKWDATHMAVVSTVGSQGQPHSAVVESVKFSPDGSMTTLVYEDALRRKDLQRNPKLSVVKIGQDGSAMTIYGTASEVPDSLKESFGGKTVTLRIEPTHIFGIIPKPRD